MPPCAPSCSTRRDSRGSPTFPAPGEAMRVIASRPLRFGRREDRERPGRHGARTRGRRGARGRRPRRARPPPAVRRLRALPGRSRVDLRCLRGGDHRSRRIRRGSRGREHGVPLPDEIDDATGTYVEPLACVLRGAERVPRGRVLVVGHGFVGRLFAEVLRRRGDDVFAVDANPERAGQAPDGPVDAAVLCASGRSARDGRRPAAPSSSSPPPPRSTWTRSTAAS